jgi:outer membrane protein assembly factor BamB
LSSPAIAYSSTLAETLVYEGNEGGYVTAFDATTGGVVWSVDLGSAIKTSPLVEGNNVWVAPTYGGHLYKLNASTGATECQARMASITYASPVFASPPGGQPSIYMGVNPQGAVSGPVYAFNEANCSTEWMFSKYNQPAGIWDPLSYTVDATGEPLVLFGTADPDESVYAIDANTGAEVWRYQTSGTGDIDIGAGVDASPPGANGFADGVAYVPGKDGIMYAIDLTTGALVWSFNFQADSHMSRFGSISTPALTGNDLLFGYGAGIYSLNAMTGAKNWIYNDGGTPVDSAVAVVGPPGQQAAAFTTLGGQFQVVDVATGALLYSYQTGNYVTASPADVDGNLIIASSDGFLYDFAPGGGNGVTPTTAVTTPSNGSTVPNPDGPLTISGTASASDGVTAVKVAVQEDGLQGAWWNATANAWTSGPADNPATLGSPGATTTTWAVTVPPPARGTVLSVLASAVGTNGQADITADGTSPSPARTAFTVAASTTAPVVTVPQQRLAPASSTSVTGSGFGSSETVDLSLPTEPPVALGSTKTTTSGSFTVSSVKLPNKVGFGPTTLVATGQTSGRTGSASIYISNNWSQYGYGPTRTSFEPNDGVIAQHVIITAHSFLVQAWDYPTTGPIASSPAVSAGVAYVDNNAGAVTAVNVLTGAPVWTTLLGATNVLDSSPAVDGGLVILGTGKGNVVALNTANGTNAWTTPAGSAVESSPAVTGGVVYVGTDGGSLLALNETTGAVLWTKSLGGQVQSSPAVDPAAGVAVVGDSNGTVTAVSTSNGAVVWSFNTGAAVKATPLVTGGNVYVGSTNGTMYALNEATGATVWTVSLGGPITASAALSNGDVAIGASTGSGGIQYLSLKAGRVDHQTPSGSGVIGVAFVNGIIVATLANGKVVAARPQASYLAWSWQSPGSFSSAPAIVNGVVYVTSQNDNLYAFAVPGQGVN